MVSADRPPILTQRLDKMRRIGTGSDVMCDLFSKKPCVSIGNMKETINVSKTKDLEGLKQLTTYRKRYFQRAINFVIGESNQ